MSEQYNDMTDIIETSAEESTPNTSGKKQRLSAFIFCVVFFMILAILISASGVHLAIDGAGNMDDARLIGVFITTEHLNLPSNTPTIITGRVRRNNFDDLFRPGRLYAQWCGDAFEFTFPEIEGIPFFSPISPPTGQSDDIIHFSQIGQGIRSHGMHITHGDYYTGVEMEGTIYAIPGSVTIIYMNRVFQTADGQVFLEAGSGFSYHGTVGEGRVFSSTLSETRTTTENGAEAGNSISVTINHVAMFAPEAIAVLQMDANNHVIMHTVLTPDDVAAKLSSPGAGFYLEAQTEYVIVETHRGAAAETGREVLREIINKGEDRADAFFAREDGILVAGWLRVVWQ